MKSKEKKLVIKLNAKNMRDIINSINVYNFK